MERTLVALWFADIAGYSARAAKDESGALRLIQILQELASETVPHLRGRVVKFVGDAVLARFPSAELAVRAAIALSTGLAGGDWIPQDPDGEQLRNHPRFQTLVQQLRCS